MTDTILMDSYMIFSDGLSIILGLHDRAQMKEGDPTLYFPQQIIIVRYTNFCLHFQYYTMIHLLATRWC